MAVSNDVSYKRSCDFTSKLITFESTWTIEDINRLCSAEIVGQPAVCSPIFIAPPDKITTDDKAPVEFRLRFFPKGRVQRGIVTISLDLMNHPGLEIMYSHSVVLANGEKHHLWSDIKKFDRASLESLNTSINIGRELLDPANPFVSNGSITFHCEVNIIVTQPKQSDLCDQLQDKYSQPEQLAKSYGDLLESGSHSDVTLVLVDDHGKELRAHKLVLITRSRVFADMFKFDMTESATNRVEIVETRVEVFTQVLHFIYTGRITSLDGMAKDVLICADKYQLDPLKSICEDFLIESITSKCNLFDLLELANLHDAPKLMATVVHLMRKSIEAQLDNVDKVVQMKRLLSSSVTDEDKEDLETKPFN